jgi:hypothetical protein
MLSFANCVNQFYYQFKTGDSGDGVGELYSVAPGNQVSRMTEGF